MLNLRLTLVGDTREPADVHNHDVLPGEMIIGGSAFEGIRRTIGVRVELIAQRGEFEIPIISLRTIFGTSNSKTAPES
jgi:hypothetical protein